MRVQCVLNLATEYDEDPESREGVGGRHRQTDTETKHTNRHRQIDKQIKKQTDRERETKRKIDRCTLFTSKKPIIKK